MNADESDSSVQTLGSCSSPEQSQVVSVAVLLVDGLMHVFPS